MRTFTPNFVLLKPFIFSACSICLRYTCAPKKKCPVIMYLVAGKLEQTKPISIVQICLCHLLVDTRNVVVGDEVTHQSTPFLIR